MLDTKIVNARIIDGSGRAAVPADVGILGWKIAAIGDLRETAAEDLAAMGAIKDALDPLHILNDQKAYIQGGPDHAETV